LAGKVSGIDYVINKVLEKEGDEEAIDMDSEGVIDEEEKQAY